MRIRGRAKIRFRPCPLASEDNCLHTWHVRFAWDLPKAGANLRVHGVSFAEAATVLEDDFALTRGDPDRKSF